MTLRCTRCRQDFVPSQNERRCGRCTEYYKSYYAQRKDSERARHAEWAAKNKAYLAAYQAGRRRAGLTKEHEKRRSQKPQRVGRRLSEWRKYHLKHAYGMSIDEYRDRCEAQHHQCAICGDSPPVLHVDHCHSSGAVRSLLCGRCNRGLGQFMDDEDRLARAIRYLRHHRNFQ